MYQQTYCLPPWSALLAPDAILLLAVPAPFGEVVTDPINPDSRPLSAVIGAADLTVQRRNPGEACPRFC